MSSKPFVPGSSLFKLISAYKSWHIHDSALNKTSSRKKWKSWRRFFILEVGKIRGSVSMDDGAWLRDTVTQTWSGLIRDVAIRTTTSVALSWYVKQIMSSCWTTFAAAGDSARMCRLNREMTILSCPTWTLRPGSRERKAQKFSQYDFCWAYRFMDSVHTCDPRGRTRSMSRPRSLNKTYSLLAPVCLWRECHFEHGSMHRWR